jgi:signal transduction histidine kinase
MMEARGITVDVDLASGISVLADRTRLYQVMLNLMSNAVKYNRDDGSIRVAARLVDGDKVRISLADTGHGIPDGQMVEIFEPFTRLDDTASSVDGIGLGLTISKRFVETMGGRIGVESELGVGTTFWVEFSDCENHQAD